MAKNKKDKKKKFSLTSLLEGYWWLIVLGTVGMIVEVVCQLLLPKLMGTIIDKGITPAVTGAGTAADGKALIAKFAVLMITIAIIAVAGGVTNAKTTSIVSQGYGWKLRDKMFEKIATFSFGNIDKFSTASLTTRLTNDVTTIQNMIIMILRMLVRAPAMLIVAVVLAVSINAGLASLLLLALPLIIVAVVFIMAKGFPMFEKMQKKIDNLNRVVQENLIGIRVVKAFVREDHEKGKFKEANDSLTEQGTKASSLIVTAMPVMMLIFNAAIVTVLYKGGIDISNGKMQAGELISFISYVGEILMSLLMVAMLLIQVARGKACLNRIQEVLNTDVDITNKEETVNGTNSGKVEFKNVSFKYSTNDDGDNILNDISFVAEAGQVIGIVGGTGSGKSSLVSLIPRLYDTSSGSVLVDGVDVKDYDMKTLRDEIGVVLQKNTLFSGTIKDNIRWGKEDATDEEVVNACKAAQADEFITEQPNGYDTDLSQGGLNLSGGQKQRLCIARAMIKKPKILILDDSTSAVDTATEAKIRQSFYNELKGTTVFIIAQRISSVENADQILVLDDGEIKGIGTHDELIESNEIYQEIVKTQQKGVSE